MKVRAVDNELKIQQLEARLHSAEARAKKAEARTANLLGFECAPEFPERTWRMSIQIDAARYERNPDAFLQMIAIEAPAAFQKACHKARF